MARLRLGCQALLAGAVETSDLIVRGAGSFSVSPVLRCAYVVPDDNLAFEFIRLQLHLEDETQKPESISALESLLDFVIDQVKLCFSLGIGSPYNVDLEGNTLLHVRETFLRKEITDPSLDRQRDPLG